MSTVLRGGRLSSKTRRDVVDFISSRESDRRIAGSIVLVNEAHVVSLLNAGVIRRREARKLFRELRRLENTFPKHGIGEDYHLYVEEELTKRLGPELGGKLHTGKSRNDQVATAIRMSLRELLLNLSDRLLSLVDKLLDQAAKHTDIVFVGYTHQQPAQPITYGHYLASIAGPLLRDDERIFEAYRRVNMSPMGSGALAGSSFDLDRGLVAQLLGFEGMIENSLDGVSGRDFLLESLAVCSLLASDLSRLAQDWIFYGSSDVSLIEISPEYSSTSSLMPQKKNADPFEIVRARCARVAANYTTAISMTHALPTGYNLDFQELTPLVWDSIDTLCSCLSVMTGGIASSRVVTGIADRPQVQLTVATEVANSLVRTAGASFREAYRWVGQAVRIVLRDHRTLRELTGEEWSQIAGRPLTAKTYRTILRVADPESNPGLYRTEGSPNPRDVKRKISLGKRTVDSHLRRLEGTRGQLQRASRRMRKIL